MSEMTTKKRAAFSLPTREVACPDCGQGMDLGDFPERYLSIFR